MKRRGMVYDVGCMSGVNWRPDCRHGTNYLDMPWEPKQAFHAVAGY